MNLFRKNIGKSMSYIAVRDEEGNVPLMKVDQGIISLEVICFEI